MIGFSQVGFRYAQSDLLFDDLCVTIQSGQRVCLLGRNGSGKTTLLKLIAGLLLPCKGDVIIDGISTRDVRRLKEVRAKIGFIFQNPEDQIVATTVESDIAFALENLGVDRRTISRRIEKCATKFNLSQLLKRHPMELSAGEKQRTALASVMAVEPEILLLDEPTSFLDHRGRRQLFDEVFADRRVTVVAATQYPSEVAKYDRVILFDNHQIAFDGSPDEFHGTAFWRVIADSDDSASDDGALRDTSFAFPEAERERAISVRDVTFGYSPRAEVLKGINLTIPMNAITAVVGDSGSGKTTLALLLAGLIRPEDGETFLGDRQLDREEVAVLFQFPETSFFAETVFEEVAFGARNLGLSDSEIRRRALCALQLAQLPFDAFAERSPFSLSAGEKRRVAIAAVLAMDRPIILFDETTIGLDWEARRAMVRLLQELKKSGRTVIIMTHDWEFVEQIAEYLVILDQGEVFWQGCLNETDLPWEYVSAHFGCR